MYYAPKNGNDSYDQNGIDLITEIKFSKNGKNINKGYLFKFNSERILLKEFLQNEFVISKPKLIISLNCELKRSDLMSINRMNIFIENIERLISDNETWIIGAGLNVGIHKMIGKIVTKFKIVQNNGFPVLIGINNWQNIIDNETINSNSMEYIINKNFTPGRFSLNSYYENLFFVDENDYDKEISFYNHFDNVLRDYEAFSVQIVYGGDKMNLEKAYKYLKDSNLIVVIKDSGGIADLIAAKMELSDAKFDEQIGKFNINESDLQLVKDRISDMHNIYQNEIIIFDLRNRGFRLDESLYQALMKKKINPEKQFIYSLIFDEGVINKFDIPEIANIKELKPIMKKVLLNKKIILLKLLLSNIKNIDKYFTNEDMEYLYQESTAINDEDSGDLNNMYYEYFKLNQTASRQGIYINNIINIK